MRGGSNSAPSDFDAEVGGRIRALREERGKTQEWLARQLGVSQPQVHRYEAGQSRLTFSVCAAIAAALGANVITLLPPAFTKRLRQPKKGHDHEEC